MGWRVCVVIRGSYDMTIRSPRILEQAEAMAQISKVRESRAISEAGGERTQCVGLDWLSVEPGHVLAAYVVDEADEALVLQPAQSVSTGAPATPSSGEPFV